MHTDGNCFKYTVCTGASEGSEETKHWRGKQLFVNIDLPLQCFVYSEPSDASECVWLYCLVSNTHLGGWGGGALFSCSTHPFPV